jgi:hypothetical protein
MGAPDQVLLLMVGAGVALVLLAEMQPHLPRVLADRVYLVVFQDLP